jgi:hypothetical protein
MSFNSQSKREEQMDTFAKFDSWFLENTERIVWLNLSIPALLAIHGNLCLGLKT